VIWAVAGVLAVALLAASFRTRGVAPALLADDAAVLVQDGPDALVLAPARRAADVGLLFFPGGGVDPEAYSPLLRPVAAAGHRVVVPRLPWRFAPFDSHRREALERARRATRGEGLPTRWVVAGHSKGGRLACELVAAGFPALAGLVLVGTTHPRELDLTALRVPVAKVYGTADGIAPSEDVLAGARRLPPGTAWIELPGANHAQFGHYGPQFLDGEATMTREEQQARTRAVLLERLGGASRAGR
jgi:pimeloyl-ACP methyl ester carboxylesterase